MQVILNQQRGMLWFFRWSYQASNNLVFGINIRLGEPLSRFDYRRSKPQEDSYSELLLGKSQSSKSICWFQNLQIEHALYDTRFWSNTTELESKTRRLLKALLGSSTSVVKRLYASNNIEGRRNLKLLTHVFTN
jgi:hypothetical protein